MYIVWFAYPVVSSIFSCHPVVYGCISSTQRSRRHYCVYGQASFLDETLTTLRYARSGAWGLRSLTEEFVQSAPRQRLGLGWTLTIPTFMI